MNQSLIEPQQIYLWLCRIYKQHFVLPQFKNQQKVIDVQVNSCMSKHFIPRKLTAVAPSISLTSKSLFFSIASFMSSSICFSLNKASSSTLLSSKPEGLDNISNNNITGGGHYKYRTTGCLFRDEALT